MNMKISWKMIQKIQAIKKKENYYFFQQCESLVNVHFL